MRLFLRSNFVILLFLYSCVSGQRTDGEKQYTVSQINEDFQVFRKTLEEAHPGLYWYNSREVLDKYFDSLVDSINQPMSSMEFIKFLLPAVAKIRCAHTTIRPGEDLKPEMLRKRKLFPLNLAFLHGAVFLKDSLIQIKSINGTPINEIIDQIIAIIPADGFNKTFKYHWMSTGGFQEGYALLFGEPEEFLIEGNDSSNNPVKLKLNAINGEEYLRSRSEAHTQMKLSFPDSSSALLSINSFVISGPAFISEIENAFEKIKLKKSTQLIIDLRNNHGGNNANVSRLYSFLSEKPFYHLKKTEVIGKQLTYGKYISNYREITDMGSNPSADGTRNVDFEYRGRTLIPPASQNAFTGKLIVLANGGTGSAASEFVALVHGNKRGLIVGEETGGCYYGSTGGTYARLVLPNTGINVTIPMVRIHNYVEETFTEQPAGRGTLPDYEFPVLGDFGKIGNDKWVEFALNLFKK